MLRLSLRLSFRLGLVLCLVLGLGLDLNLSLFWYSFGQSLNKDKKYEKWQFSLQKPNFSLIQSQESIFKVRECAQSITLHKITRIKFPLLENKFPFPKKAKSALFCSAL
jgi:hypothetical protein